MADRTPDLQLLALVISRSLVQIPLVVMGLLLIEISDSFGIAIGVTGQLRTIASFLGLVFSLLIGALSVRISYKTLLGVGVTFFAISSVGCAVAPNFATLCVAYSMTGIGFALVTSMATAMVGDLIPREKRAVAMGLVLAGNSLMFVIATLVTNYAAGLSGWRASFLVLGLPVSTLALLLVMKLPKTSNPITNNTFQNILIGYKNVVKNRSAITCLLGNSLSMAVLTFYAVYLASYWRQFFALSRETAAILLIIIGLLSTLGGLVSGRIINVIGRKNTTTISILVIGLSTILVTGIPLLLLSLLFTFINQVFVGIMNSSIASLTLEQIPEYRGTLMSLLSVASNIGQMFSAVAGFILILYNYSILGLILGVLGVVSAVMIHKFSLDPFKN